jgi:hypothetical protein
MSTNSIPYGSIMINKPTLTSSNVKLRNGNNSNLTPVKHEELQIIANIAQNKGEKEWYNFFSSCSRGKFPKGLKYSNMVFTFKNKGKIITYQLKLSYDYELVYNDCKKFISNTCGFDENEDTSNLIFEGVEPPPEIIKWSSLYITKKIELIKLFSLRKSEEYNLDENETNNLSTTLIYMTSSGLLDNSRFIMDTTSIVHINGLEFTTGKFRIAGSNSTIKKPVGNTEEISQKKVNVFPSSKIFTYLAKKGYSFGNEK